MRAKQTRLALMLAAVMVGAVLAGELLESAAAAFALGCSCAFGMVAANMRYERAHR